MPGVTHALMLAGVSVARNEKLAQVFYRLNIIEAFGTGIPRVFSAYEKSPVKPEIPVVDGGFLIRLPNLNYHVNNNGDGGIAAGSNEQKLHAAFPECFFSKEDAAEVLGFSESGAYKILRRMKDQGVLHDQKSGKKKLYAFSRGAMYRRIQKYGDMK